MSIPFNRAEVSPTHQRAILDVTIGGFPMGTIVYTSGEDLPHSGWKCVFPDGSARVVTNDKIRLCW